MSVHPQGYPCEAEHVLHPPPPRSRPSACCSPGPTTSTDWSCSFSHPTPALSTRGSLCSPHPPGPTIASLASSHIASSAQLPQVVLLEPHPGRDHIPTALRVSPSSHPRGVCSSALCSVHIDTRLQGPQVRDQVRSLPAACGASGPSSKVLLPSVLSDYMMVAVCGCARRPHRAPSFWGLHLSRLCISKSDTSSDVCAFLPTPPSDALTPAGCLSYNLTHV